MHCGLNIRSRALRCDSGAELTLASLLSFGQQRAERDPLLDWHTCSCVGLCDGAEFCQLQINRHRSEFAPLSESKHAEVCVSGKFVCLSVPGRDSSIVERRVKAVRGYSWRL